MRDEKREVNSLKRIGELVKGTGSDEQPQQEVTDEMGKSEVKVGLSVSDEEEQSDAVDDEVEESEDGDADDGKSNDEPDDTSESESETAPPAEAEKHDWWKSELAELVVDIFGKKVKELNPDAVRKRLQDKARKEPGVITGMQ